MAKNHPLPKVGRARSAVVKAPLVPSALRFRVAQSTMLKTSPQPGLYAAASYTLMVLPAFSPSAPVTLMESYNPPVAESLKALTWAATVGSAA